MKLTYFDNAATSFPKPNQVLEYIKEYLENIGGSYGRGAYGRILESSRTVEQLRDKLAIILGTKNSDSIVFTMNATHAINTLLFGYLQENDHVLVSPLEHNAVMRPLEEIRKVKRITYEILPCFDDGLIDIQKIKTKLKPSTKLVIINHQSNVNGLIQPIEDIKKEIREIPILLDVSQSLGHTAVKLDDWDIDFCAFTGHKGLLGPTGTGGLFMRNIEPVKPFLFGGTGSKSESFEMPHFAPDKYEAGTPNILGLFGLLGAIENFPDRHFTGKDFNDLLNACMQNNKLKIFKANNTKNQGLLFSFTHSDLTCDKVSQYLYEKYKIDTRSGLHCAPLAHQTLNTYPSGTVRIAPSVYHTPEDLIELAQILQEI